MGHRSAEGIPTDPTVGAGGSARSELGNPTESKQNRGMVAETSVCYCVTATLVMVIVQSREISIDGASK